MFINIYYNILIHNVNIYNIDNYRYKNILYLDPYLNIISKKKVKYIMIVIIIYIYIFYKIKYNFYNYQTFAYLLNFISLIYCIETLFFEIV